MYEKVKPRVPKQIPRVPKWTTKSFQNPPKEVPQGIKKGFKKATRCQSRPQGVPELPKLPQIDLKPIPKPFQMIHFLPKIYFRF